MPSVIYVAISLPGFIRCPVDANPPVTLVKWKKDGLPLRIDKVSWCAVSPQTGNVTSSVEVSYDSIFHIILWFSERFSVSYLSERIQ